MPQFLPQQRRRQDGRFGQPVVRRDVQRDAGSLMKLSPSCPAASVGTLLP